MSLTVRQSFIMAALCGWKGDDPCGWQSPTEEKTLIQWAKSHCTDEYQENDYKIELSRLVNDGLFFQVYPDIFEEPAYYCSYDPMFLNEVFSPDNDLEAFELWKEWAADYDRQFSVKWRRYVICYGGGSQSVSTPNYL